MHSHAIADQLSSNVYVFEEFVLNEGKKTQHAQSD